MNTNEAIVLYIQSKDKIGGKSCPVLLYSNHNDYMEVMNITSEYENKSRKVKKNYYPIINWKEAGLKSKSWIDIGKIHVFMKEFLQNINIDYVGKLPVEDEVGLVQFSKTLRKKE